MRVVPLVIIIIIIIFIIIIIIIITSDNEDEEVLFSPIIVCLFVCLSVCEQLPDHSFSCGVMKLSGNNCFFFMNGNTERAQCALSRVCIP